MSVLVLYRNHMCQIFGASTNLYNIVLSVCIFVCVLLCVVLCGVCVCDCVVVLQLLYSRIRHL
jgi:hypothetical protein